MYRHILIAVLFLNAEPTQVTLDMRQLHFTSPPAQAEGWGEQLAARPFSVGIGEKQSWEVRVGQVTAGDWGIVVRNVGPSAASFPFSADGAKVSRLCGTTGVSEVGITVGIKKLGSSSRTLYGCDSVAGSLLKVDPGGQVALVGLSEVGASLSGPALLTISTVFYEHRTNGWFIRREGLYQLRSVNEAD